jgi:hypothetical protein
LGTGSLTLNSGSTFGVELNGNTVGTQYDQLNVTGSVNLGGATLNVVCGFPPSNGDTFTILSNDGTDAVVGSFSGLSEGATVDVAGKTFTISYRGGDGNDVAAGSTTVRVLPILTFAASGSSVSESAGDVAIEARLSDALPVDLVLRLAVIGTAADPADYALSGNPLVIAAGALSGSVHLGVVDDRLDELDETVVLTMASPTGVVLGDVTTHTVTVVDNDLPPRVMFTAASQSVAENVGTVTVTARLSEASGLDVTLPLVLSGTATTPADYSVSAASISIPAGATTGSATITIVDDAAPEGNETVILRMSSPTNATLSTLPGTTTEHTVTIAGSDAPSFTFSRASQTVDERYNNQQSAIWVLTATLSEAYADRDIKVPLKPLSTAAGMAVLGSDFRLPAGLNNAGYDPADHTIRFPAGQTEAMVSIEVLDDTVIEGTETIKLEMDSAATEVRRGATTTFVMTITDNDYPTVSFTTQSSEVWEDIPYLRVSVSLSQPSLEGVTVPIKVVGGSAIEYKTNYYNYDYRLSSTSIFIPANATSASQVEIGRIRNDAWNESAETIGLALGTPTGAKLGSQTTHTVTIRDDDPRVSFAANQSVVEDRTIVTFKASLLDKNNNPTVSNKPVTVPFTLAGTAVRNADYIISPAPGSDGRAYLTIPAGWPSQDITVTVYEDSLDEADETVVVTMDTSRLVNALAGTTQHTVTINDDDGPPRAYFYMDPYDKYPVKYGSTVPEMSRSYTLSVRLTAPSGQWVTVPIACTGTATNGTDYTMSSTSIATATAWSTRTKDRPSLSAGWTRPPGSRSQAP